MEDERTETAEQPDTATDSASADPAELQKQRDEYVFKKTGRRPSSDQ